MLAEPKCKNKKKVQFISNDSRQLIYQHIHSRTNAANFKDFSINGTYLGIY